MLIAVFIAIFLVGLLYYMIGISQTLMVREKLQDGADAAVLSSAVMHARAMNVIVFINIIMAAILSLLVTVKLLETLAIIGICIAVGLAWCTMGSSLSFVPPLNTIRSTMQNIYSELKDPVYSALSALHSASTVVVRITPFAAIELTRADIEANAAPPDARGTAFPTRNDLPVESDSFSELCGRAAEVPIKLAAETLGSAVSILESPMHELASALSDWFCGDGGSNGGSYPPRQQSIDRTYPRNQTAIDCEQQSLGEQKVNPDVAERTCAKSQQEEEAAAPDKSTGGCQIGHDCTLGGAYDGHAALARAQCEPTIAPAPKEYYYQTRDGEVEYQWNGKIWVRHDPTYKTPRYVEKASAPPCGPLDMHPSIAEGYNKTIRKHDDVREVLPVCSNEVAPSLFLAPKVGTTETVKFTEVLQMLGCTRTETKTIDMSNAQRVEQSGDKKSPMRVQLQTDDGKSINLGDENFQLRSILHTGVPGTGAEGVMRLALWGKSSPDNPLAFLNSFRSFSVAQAEFFYNGNGPRSDWMWNMNWQARFRRVRFPEGEAMQAVDGFCGALSGACDFVGQYKTIYKMVVH